MDASIYLLDDSELALFEANQKGYRNDVYVRIKHNYYKVNIYSYVRIVQDFETEHAEYGYFSIDNNIVLVKEVTNEEIKSVLFNLIKQNYFADVKPIDNNKALELTFLEL